jgi:ATP-dependent metalloprotease
MQDSTSPVLQSDHAFELYVSALVKNGLESSVNAAVRRREGILASVATTADAHSSTISSPQTSTTLAPEPATTPQASPSAIPTLSRSESIAQKILTGGPIGSSASVASGRLDTSQFASALASGAGVSGNPIHVTVAERKSDRAQPVGT